MDYAYTGYAEDKRLISGRVSAASEEVARQILSRNRYRILTLKAEKPFMPSKAELLPSFFAVKPQAVIMFSRQLALLLESGTDIVTSLELLQSQAENGSFKKVLGQIIADLRDGNRLSAALQKHPKVFPQMYVQSLIVGEQSGGLEKVLRQVASYLEKENTTSNATKSALKYPIFVSLVAVVVIVVMITFVFPSFASLYEGMGAKLPMATRMVIGAGTAAAHYGIFVLIAMVGAGFGLVAYKKTPAGRLRWDGFMLRIPVMGRISHMSELARCCRSMSLLIGAGLPLPQIMTLVLDSCQNSVIKSSLDQVRQQMLHGEGVSKPMSKDPIFMPMMVQMASVGEKTGNLDVTLLAVAENYETEASEKTKSMIGMITPALTIAIAVVVGIIALSMVSVMYSIYGQMG